MLDKDRKEKINRINIYILKRDRKEKINRINAFNN